MKSIAINRVLSICIATICTSTIVPQLVRAQIPTIVEPTTTPAVPQGTPTNTNSNSNSNSNSNTNTNTNTAAASKLEVKCEDLKTVVKKGDRQATMMTWNTDYFGRNFSNAKRCQAVSERLQKAANLNGGTFQGLELASGTVNSQTAICALQNGKKKCDGDNILFTLKPENAKNPEAVIQQILKFGEDGSGSVEESARPRSKVDLNLGNWERKAFANNRSSNSNSQGKKTGF
jgi:Circadian oscillating protein COP23